MLQTSFIKTIKLFFAVSTLLYLTYHTIQGERGVLAWGRLNHKISTLQKELDYLTHERATLENKVKLLQGKSLDLDMLEERVSEIINWAPESASVYYEQQA